MCKTVIQAYIRKTINIIHHIKILKEKNNMSIQIAQGKYLINLNL